MIETKMAELSGIPENLVLEVESELLDLFLEWDLSMDAIAALSECSINSVELLTIIHSHDIDEVFNQRHLLAEKIKFRHNLQKWRTDHGYDVMSCCGSGRVPSTKISKWLETTNQESPKSPVNIREVLEKSILGKDILKKYVTSNSLNNSEQTAIVRLIVEHFAFTNIKMDPKIMSTVAEEITKIFPTENVSTYYVPRRNKRNPSGKIYDRYFNTAHKRKKDNPSASENLETLNEANKDINNETALDNSEYELKKKWLAFNIPSDITTPWKETSALRMKEKKILKEKLEDWPRYKDPNGPDLIDIDFETLYPGKGNMMFEAIDGIREKLVNLFPDMIKDKLNLERFNKTKCLDIPQDSKMLHFFHLLHALILPPRINKSNKPSISDAQEDMIVHLLNLNNFKHIQQELIDTAAKEGLKVQPMVFVVGESVEKLKEFLVYVDGMIYKVASLVRAIDLVIKMCFVFNLEYSLKSKYVWGFLQEAIYEIPSTEEIPKVKNILSKIKNVK